METGTLKELNVKPGDEIVCLSHKGCFTVGASYYCHDAGKIYDDHGDVWPLEHSGTYPMAEFRIISRANQANHTPDLTAITTPFGLLDEATQEALRAHGGPYERWSGTEWRSVCGPMNWFGDTVYRVNKQPIIETVTLYGWPDQFLGNTTGAEPLIMTYQTFDGEPDWSTLKVESR